MRIWAYTYSPPFRYILHYKWLREFHHTNEVTNKVFPRRARAKLSLVHTNKVPHEVFSSAFRGQLSLVHISTMHLLTKSQKVSKSIWSLNPFRWSTSSVSTRGPIVRMSSNPLCWSVPTNYGLRSCPDSITSAFCTYFWQPYKYLIF